MILTAPSKSFFVGEYLALTGGRVIVAATEPRFELRVRAGQGGVAGIAEASPAGRWIANHDAFFSDFDVEFSDPHRGAGGWGASAAQFLTCYVTLQRLSVAACVRASDRIDIRELLQAYGEVAWDGQGVPPSGADVVAQLTGRLIEFGKKDGVRRKHEWPFEDMAFYFIATGHKIATHEHLRQLGPVDTEVLAQLAGQVSEALQTVDAGQLIDGVNGYAGELQRQSLVHPGTLALLEDLASLPGMLACKGCGALGADVALAIIDAKARQSFESWVAGRSVISVGPNRLADGLTVAA